MLLLPNRHSPYCNTTMDPIRQFAYYRKFLTPGEQAVYDNVATALCQLKFRMRLAGEVPAQSLGRIISALRYDHPELMFGLGRGGGSCTMVRSTVGTFSMLELPLACPRQELLQKIRQIEEVSWRIRNDYQKGPLRNDLETARWLHDLLTTSVRYGDPGRPACHTLAGPLLDNEAVCEGISIAYKYLCNIVGLKCIVVVGELLDEGGIPTGCSNHSWNLVHLRAEDTFTDAPGGKNLFVDVTNDISQNGPKLDYFAKTRSQLWHTHRPADLRSIPETVAWS